MSWPVIVPIALVSSLACTHSDPFGNTGATVGPFTTGTDVQLTFNADQDYWPMWTQDGKGILYAYVDLEHPTHRCMGLLAPTGGTRVWQFCETRAARIDTSVSYGAFALDSTGRLLYTEVTARTGASTIPVVRLWIADTAHPLARTALLTLPADVGGGVVSWLSDITWTGPANFVALGQQLSIMQHCDFCAFGQDSVFQDSANIVVTGTISQSGATIVAVAGTSGATAYSLAAGGTTVAFTRKHQLQLFAVAVTGGIATPVPVAGRDSLQTQAGELLGVSCKGTVCLAALDGILPTGFYWEFNLKLNAWALHIEYARLLNSTAELRQYSLGSSSSHPVATTSPGAIYSVPRISPTSSDVVVQVGGTWGHLQSVSSPGGDLHLLRGVGP